MEQNSTSSNTSCKQDVVGLRSPYYQLPSAKQRQSERIKRLRDLHLKRNEARKLNHQEVIEEDQRNKLPLNWENKIKWAEVKLEEELKRQEAVSRGEDYDQVKLLEVGADDAEKWERKKKKKNPDKGFSDYEAATARKYHRFVKQLKPNMEEYNKKKEEMGEAFYPGRDTIIHGMHKDTKECVDRMVADLEKQIDKRSKYSRRRRIDEDADIDYINERNMNFNKKLERFYGQYTTEIKQNLERGTAV
ncbi:pre-mRNA-splicing factor SYF2-like [Limulus polyphemus]|uniref:Pre-mRNA-splicing factor SYF2 n=1 Tax=Limulus polyphemus TaxID=6850 RepID=A0ABM1BG84_LIMPO|nr:pre-mRNA-splicing factor SYF2-like [Limulus polyphemus]